MDTQDAVKLDLEQGGAAFSEPIPATMSRGSELEQETPAAAGKQSHKATVAGTQTGEAEAISELAMEGQETSTPLKKELSPSQSEVDPLALLPALGTSPPNANVPVPVHAVQSTHMHCDFSGASFNIIRDSNISETQLSLVATPSIGNGKNSQGPKGNSQPVNSPNNTSHLFATACLCIARCLEDEGKLDDLALVAGSWSCSDTTEKLLPDACAAQTVVKLFQQATKRHLWHWLDFENLVQLLDAVGSEKAKIILQDYEKHLLPLCEEELSTLIPYTENVVPPTETAWMDVKWNGDRTKFKVGSLYQCKKFLAHHLGIPSEAFVFYELYPGCITLRWVVLAHSVHAAIEAKSCAGPIQFLGAEMEIKLVPPVKLKQMITQSSNTEVIILDEAYFGNTEYLFFQPVPQHAKCPVCLSVLQNAFVSNCCCAAFCLSCCEMIEKAKGSCPLCRCTDFQHTKADYIDKHVVGNLYARCSRCDWVGYLSDAMSAAHPCVLNPQTPSEVVEEKESETLEPAAINGETQVQESVLSEVPPVEDQTDLNEKAPGPMLEMMSTLRSDIQAMQMHINDDRLSSHSGDPSLSAAAEALYSGMDDITTLLQRYENTLLAAERSTASCADRQLPASVSELANLEHDEQHSGLVPTTGLSQAYPQAYLPGQETMATPPVPARRSQEPTPQAKLRPSTGTPLMGPLHLACWHGMHGKLRQLVDQGADINALGMFGMTPLHMAMLQGHAEIVLDLISLGADTSLLSHPGLLMSDLHVAGANSSDREALSMQLYTKANLVHEVRRLLHLAVTAGDALLVEQLIRSTNVHPDHSTHTGQSLLFIACQQGYVKMTEKLLSLGASVRFPSAFGRTPLHGASYSGSLPCLALLLEKNAPVNVHDVAGDTPLHAATRLDHAEVVRMLLKQDCAVNCADSIGRTPLHFAAQVGNCEVVALLHKSGASLDVKEHGGITPVHVAVMVGKVDAVKELLDAGADPNLPTTDLGLTPLHSAARRPKEGIAILQLLNQAKANVAAHDRKNRGLLYYAVRSGSIEVVQYVVDLGCTIDDDVSPSKPASDLEKHRSAEHDSQHREFPTTGVDGLIEVSGMHSDDMSPLHLAVLLGYVEIVDFLIRKGADARKVTSTGFTAIHMAVRSGNPHLIRQMVGAGCNPNHKTHDGFAPLHLAAQWGHKEAAVMLIRIGCNKEIQIGSNQLQKPQTHSLTAVLIAAMNHQTDLVCTLIEEGCQVQATTADNSNAIHLAVLGLQSVRQNPDPFQQVAAGYLSHRSSDVCETVKLLAKHGCNVNAVNSEGLTPLDLLQNMRRNLKMHNALPYFGYNLKYAEMEELYRFMRQSKALTSHEIQHRESLTLTLSQMTTNAKDIEAKLKTSQKHLPKNVQEQCITDILNRCPSSFNLTRLVVPRVSRLWHEIGEHLDINTTLLELAFAQCAGDRQECCKRVFGLWLHGAGKRPITWRTVLDALREVGEGVLADSVMQQLQNAYES